MPPCLPPAPKVKRCRSEHSQHQRDAACQFVDIFRRYHITSVEE